MFLRVTDQMFSRACGFMSKGQIQAYMIECRHIGPMSFHLKNDNGGLKFSNLDKRKRERMMQDIFLIGVLYTLTHASRADLVVQVMRKFLDMWCEIDGEKLFYRIGRGGGGVGPIPLPEKDVQLRPARLSCLF